MQKINIETNLIAKRELFRIISLNYCLGYPALFYGVPGTSKTQSFFDFVAAMIRHESAENITDNSQKPSLSIDGDESSVEASTGNNLEDDLIDISKANRDLVVSSDQAFIIELNGDTRAKEIRGDIDMEKLFKDKVLTINSKIANSRFILINEADKGNSSARNSLLGIMNERVVFNGKEKIKCNWESFMGTCNMLPNEENEDAFLDRFLIKYHVPRVTTSTIIDYYEKGGKYALFNYELNVPDASDINEFRIPKDKMTILIDGVKSHVSDRTLTKLEDIVRAVSLIWDLSINKSIIKTAELVCNSSVAESLVKYLQTPEMKKIMSHLSVIRSISDPKVVADNYSKAIKLTDQYGSEGKLSESEIKEISVLLEQIRDEKNIPKPTN